MNPKISTVLFNESIHSIGKDSLVTIIRILGDKKILDNTCDIDVSFKPKNEIIQIRIVNTKPPFKIQIIKHPFITNEVREKDIIITNEEIQLKKFLKTFDY